MVKKSTEKLNFENALNDLEALIEKMEAGELSLEESLKNFEQGISLARQCQEALKDAEQKIQILIEQNGESKILPFAAEE
jgi:exodeoxyribonuclease VII small subunit